MKLSTKISLAMGSLALIIVGIGALGLYAANSTNQAATYITMQRVPPLRLVLELDTAASDHRIAELNFMFAVTPEERQPHARTLQDLEEKMAQLVTQAESYFILPEIRQALDYYTQLNANYIGYTRKIEAFVAAGETDAAMALLRGDSRKTYDQMSEQVIKIVGLITNTLNQANDDADQQYAGAFRIVMVILAVAIILAVALTWIIVRMTMRQLGKDPGELMNMAERVTEGDYDIADGSPQIGVYGYIVQMVEALKKQINHARQESENAKTESARAQEAMKQADAASAEAQAKTQSILRAADRLEQVAQIVSSASTELSAQIEQSDRGAAESAARLSEAATAMNEMNATVLEVAKNAGAAADVSANTRQEAEHGAHIVEQSVSSILAVQTQAIALKNDMVKLDESAKAINQIMGVISDIADQTNLLALNAAIEAARAGDAGRGFAVVADEVRNLAEKTMASTTDVGNAIKAIQESAAQSMQQVDAAVRGIEDATAFANESGEALTEIVSMVDSTADQVRAIAAASEEQSAASEEINRSIGQVNAIASETAQAMNEAARAVSDLAGQANNLSKLIDDMKRV